MEKERVKVVGNNTFGVLLIVLGITTIVSMFIGYEWLRYSYILWPVFLISLGIEILYYDHKKGIEVKWSFWNVCLMGVVLSIALGISIVGSALNYIFKDSKIKERIQEKIYYELDIDYSTPEE